MNKISHSQVILDDIESSLARTDFSKTDLDNAAQLLLKINGVITPPILLALGVDSYKIIDGDFQYYAAKRAEEIEPRNAETINAYIVESENEIPIYKQQIEMFRQQTVMQQAVAASDGNYEARFVALETEMSEMKNELKSRDNALHDAIKQMGDQIVAQIKASLTMPISQQIPTKSESLPTDKPVPARITVAGDSPEERQLLTDINELDVIKLAHNLHKIKTGKIGITKIIKERNKSSFIPFQSRYDLFARRVGVQKKTFETMLENYKKLT